EGLRPIYSILILFSITVRFASPSVEIAGKSEAVGVIAHVVVVAEPRGGADGDRVIEKRSAAQHAQRTVARKPCRAVGGRALVGGVPAILDPFGGVAGSVVKAEGVGTERADRNGAR